MGRKCVGTYKGITVIQYITEQLLCIDILCYSG